MNILEKPDVFFQEHGGLHDSSIHKISFDTKANNLVLSIDDIDFDSVSSLEYNGPTPMNIHFITLLDLFINFKENYPIKMHIYNINASKREDGVFLVSIDLWGGDFGEIKILCKSIAIEDVT